MALNLEHLEASDSPLLAEPLMSLLFRLGLPPSLRDAVLRVLKRAGPRMTVLELLRAPYSGLREWELEHLQDAFEVLLEQEPGSTRGLGPVSQDELAAIAALVAQSALPDLPSWNIGGFHEGLGRGAAAATIKRVLEGKVRLLSNEGALLKRSLEELLQEERRVRTDLPQFTPTGSPRADAFLSALAPEAERLARLYPMPFIDPRVGLRVDDVRLSAEVRSGFTQFASIDWVAPGQGSSAQARCTCGLETCFHRAAALWALVDLHRLPRDAFDQLFATPWERLAHELEVAPAPPEPQALVVSFYEYGALWYLAKLTNRGVPSKTWRNVHHLGGELTKLVGRDLDLARAVALAELGGSAGDLRDFPALVAGFPRVAWGHDKTFRTCRVAHPRVEFLEREDGVTVQVRLDDEVLTRDEARGLRVNGGLAVPRLRGEDVVLYVLPQKVVTLVRALSRHGAQFPTEALPTLHDAVSRLEAVARVDLPDSLRGEEAKPSLQHRMQVVRDHSGVGLQLRVEPLPGGPLFVPGDGVPVAATFDGARRTYARRDLQAEASAAAALCATLGLEVTDGFAWQLPPGAHSIDLLRRLLSQAEHGLALEWTGTPPRFTKAGQTKHLGLRIARSKDWFDLAGALEVDGQRVALAELLEAARARRRWVQVGADDFVQLSAELVDAVAPLAHLGEGTKSPTLTLGALPTLEALDAAGADVTAATEWVKLVDRLKAARTRKVKVPKLKVTPRDYQRVGFEWLTRLADWSTGAVLADDMGLGKTLQALLLLTDRAKVGPALVVAPSSVLHTWRTEAAQHAPALKVVTWGEDVSLDKLTRAHVVLATWTTFARDADALCGHQFTTVVLDEAHAIKNGGTQRAKAAHRLKADFVLALSGTPIENHVGELWSLFRAVMPSLLGNEESFRRRFGTDDPSSREALARLIRPFILRRTKEQVATELPPRTELDVVVPLTEAEQALYEDVRLAAVAQVGEQRTNKRFEVLAALTRLRLTACHPKLVDEKWKGPTSKLDRLEELLADLTQSGHRALVFSQFTSHLALVQAALRKRGLSYSYLDGQTPLAERGRLVDQFQAGKGGAVFLISLKAGGTGLTLTAADYVIHLDPWWNPAVEDQASDRAHRLGQRKPVTVYRLIAEGTIEQKILALHGQKRELVDSLLAGTDAAGALKTEDLLALLQQG